MTMKRRNPSKITLKATLRSSREAIHKKLHFIFGKMLKFHSVPSINRKHLGYKIANGKLVLSKRPGLLSDRAYKPPMYPLDSIQGDYVQVSAVYEQSCIHRKKRSKMSDESLLDKSLEHESSLSTQLDNDNEINELHKPYNKFSKDDDASYNYSDDGDDWDGDNIDDESLSEHRSTLRDCEEDGLLGLVFMCSQEDDDVEVDLDTRFDSQIVQKYGDEDEDLLGLMYLCHDTLSPKLSFRKHLTCGMASQDFLWITSRTNPVFRCRTCFVVHFT